MYIDQLNDAEKQVLMDLLMHLVRTDNKFAKREASHLLAICKKYDVVMKFELDTSVDALCADIIRDQSKIIILQELIWAARIDCDYCNKEKEMVQTVMNNMGIKQNKYREIDVWVEKGIRWKEKGNKMISSLRDGAIINPPIITLDFCF